MPIWTVEMHVNGRVVVEVEADDEGEARTLAEAMTDDLDDIEIVNLNADSVVMGEG